MMNMKNVEGSDRGDIMLFALSTCPWCSKTKDLFNQLRVGYRYVDVDLLSGQERLECLEEVEKWNPDVSFPTIVINQKDCIVGYRENDIRQALAV